MQAGRIAWFGLTVFVASSGLAETPSARDARIESWLRTAEVVEAEAIATGTTRPSKLVLQVDDRTIRAVFKTVDVFKAGVSRELGAAPEPSFTDSYRFDRAAYLVDRLLDLRMVPVVVLRPVEGREGAAVEWVDDAISEEERRRRDVGPADPRRLAHQQFVMHLFDALILNTDRNLGNQLVTPADWRLHLIDHSRSFRLSPEIPQRLLDKPTRMPRRLRDRLAGLDRRSLSRELDGLVSSRRIRALLARRDAILRKIEQDVERYGEATVFDYRGPSNGVAAAPDTAPATGGELR